MLLVLLRAFMFNMILPSTTSIDNIYGSILRGRFAHSEGVLDTIPKITETTNF